MPAVVNLLSRAVSNLVLTHDLQEANRALDYEKQQVGRMQRHLLPGQLPHIEGLELGALFHDIGKVRVPDAILHKPGKLTEPEWLRMRNHPLYGLQILSGMKFLEGASRVVVQHHEKWDGSGYPWGLGGKEIDRNARIFAVADAFDAMLQPYGVAIYLEAQHLCKVMRGVRETCPLTRTSTWRGEYESNSSLRVEFLLATGADL